MEITRDTLFKLYVEENKNMKEIAKMLGYKTSKPILRRLKKFNIPIRKKDKTSERIGMRSFNVHGSEMEVVEYNHKGDIWVKFLEHGNLTHTQWTPFSKGTVRNVYDRTVYGVGYLGEGKYKSKITDKHTPQYEKWRSMLLRCYAEKYSEERPTYSNCSVTEEWHNFQVFGEWFDENYYEVEGQRMCLDKDILTKGNKVYSPEKCLIVPERINNLFVKRDGDRGKFPIGVSWNDQHKKYTVQCNDAQCSPAHLGDYDNPEEGFLAYKKFKESVIKQVAEEYKDKIPLKLYEAIMKYEVEITD